MFLLLGRRKHADGFRRGMATSVAGFFEQRVVERRSPAHTGRVIAYSKAKARQPRSQAQICEASGLKTPYTHKLARSELGSISFRSSFSKARKARLGEENVIILPV
jgi:hypothetical protein